MIGKVKSAMSMGMLVGYSFMNELRAEFESYDEDSSVRKDGHHFDILSSLRGVVWYADKMGLLLNDGES